MTTPTARVAANVRAIRKAHGLSAQALSGLCAAVGHPISRNTITNLAFKDYVILSGPCPNCGTTNFSYFGETTAAGPCLFVINTSVFRL